MAYKSDLYGTQLETAILAVIEKLDGTHLAEATAETSGLMSAKDKQQLAKALADIISLGKETDNITRIQQEIAKVIEVIQGSLSRKVNDTTTVNGYPLSSNIVLAGGDIKIGAQTLVEILNDATKQLNNKVPLTRKVNGISLVKDAELFAQHIRDMYSGKYLPTLFNEKANVTDVQKKADKSALEGKANLNSQGALATGEEQRLVVCFVNISGDPMVIDEAGVYYNGRTKQVEIYEMSGGATSKPTKVLSEVPSQNVVYCDKLTNTLHRWDGLKMVQLSSGGGSVDAYTKEESDKLLKGKVPTTRTINEEPLTDDIWLRSGDIPHDNWTVEEELIRLKSYKVNTDDVVQTTGQSTTAVMSQKAVTDIIGNVEQLLASI